jgi:hypothetical protein
MAGNFKQLLVNPTIQNDRQEIHTIISHKHLTSTLNKSNSEQTDAR